MDGAGLEDLGEEELLAYADTCAETARRAEVDLLHAAYQWAVLHDPRRLDPRESAMPGRERSRMLGGDGTPEVTEFAAAKLGARIGRSPYAAAALMADAMDLRHRHPVLWGRVQTGEVRASYARHVVAKTRDLTRHEAGFVDAAVAESADGRIPWSRFEALVEAQVAAAAPALAREKEERARRARFAKKTRGEAYGMATFMVRADLATINQIDAAVTALAGRLTATMPEADVDARRVRALLLFCTPGAAETTDIADLLPEVQVYVHYYAGTTTPSSTTPSTTTPSTTTPSTTTPSTTTPSSTTTAGPDASTWPTSPETDIDPETGPVERVVRVEGHGPVTESWVRDVLGPRCRFRVTPVLDLAGQAPVDAYEIPDRHRQAVHLITPADTFPYAASLSRTMQVDHTVPFDQGGVSGVGNYGPMTTGHHRVKTHGGWQVQQPFAGIYVWRDPHGAFYLVDHTGTRRLPGSATPGPAPRRKPLVIEIYRNFPTIDFTAA